MENKNVLNVWSKTLLSVFRYLDAVNVAIDDLVLKQALSRGFSGGRFSSAFETSNKMVELSVRKATLLEAESIIEQSMARLAKDDIRLLMLIYFDLIKSQQAADILGISIRTFFRRKKLAIDRFANSLKFLNYDSAKLFELLKNEEWLINLYNKNMHLDMQNAVEQDVSENIYEYSLLKSIFNDLNGTTKNKLAHSYT